MATQDNNEFQSIINDELNNIRFIIQVSDKNINRSLRLIHESKRLAEYTEDKEKWIEYMDDIIRASIVFLHSSLETTLREIVRLKLKYDGDLSTIPLIEQTGFPNRKDKFGLNDLVKYRGHTVDEVIEESIDKYLSTLSFNTTKDVTDTFARLGLPQSTLQPYYADLGNMINRRHQIVHEADIKRQNKSSELEPINVDQLIRWINSTAEFSGKAMHLACLDKIEKRLTSKGIPFDKVELSKMLTITIQLNRPSA